MLLLASVAWAARVTEAEMQQWLTEMLPAIEHETGRTFVSPRHLTLDRRANIRDAIEAYNKRLHARWPDAQGPNANLPTDVIGAYINATQEIFIVNESIADIFQRVEDDDHLLGPFVRCVIAHEATHALQHQRASIPRDAKTLAPLIEGQATLVATRLCGDPTAAALSDGTTGTDIVSSIALADPLSAYPFGRRYVERLVAGRADEEPIWSALEHPPTALEIANAVDAARIPEWQDHGPISRVMTGLTGAGGPPPWVEAATPAEFLSALDFPGMGVDNLLPAEGGLVAGKKTDGAMTMVAAFLLRDETRGRAWLATRERRMHDAEPPVPGMASPIYGRWVSDRVASLRDLSPTAMLSVRVAFSPGSHHELWAIVNGVLVAIIVRDFEHPARPLDEALRALLDSYPAKLPTIAPLNQAWFPTDPNHVSAAWTRDRQLLACLNGDEGAC